MKSAVQYFHEPAGALYHGAAMVYTLAGYLLGLYGLFSASWLINLGATLWLAHAMVIAAYHRESFGSDPEQVIPFKTQLKIFHKYRVERVLHAGGDLDGQPSPMKEDYLEAARTGKVYGGNAVSFLVSF